MEKQMIFIIKDNQNVEFNYKSTEKLNTINDPYAVIIGALTIMIEENQLNDEQIHYLLLQIRHDIKFCKNVNYKKIK